MSFKTLTRIAVGSAILGTAVLAPSVAQAKSATDLPGSFPLASCAGGLPAAGVITGAVSTGLNFKVTVPAIEPGAVYETRARVYTIVNGKQSFTTKKARISNVSDVGSGTLAAGQHIYRMDVSNLTAEANGLPALAYTSDGAIGCD